MAGDNSSDSFLPSGSDSGRRLGSGSDSGTRLPSGGDSASSVADSPDTQEGLFFPSEALSVDGSGRTTPTPETQQANNAVYSQIRDGRMAPPTHASQRQAPPSLVFSIWRSVWRIMAFFAGIFVAYMRHARTTLMGSSPLNPSLRPEASPLPPCVPQTWTARTQRQSTSPEDRRTRLRR